MTLPFYVSPEQITKDKADFARKGIARGRSLVAIEYGDGILIVAENPSGSLNKISEVYDRIAFAAVGRYNEFETLRVAGVRLADMTGFANSREDVNARALANVYAQQLGTIFTTELKPFEVELLLCEVGDSTESNEMYHVYYDGTLEDEVGFAVMGGQAEVVESYLEGRFKTGLSMSEAFSLARRALEAADSERALTASSLEVGVLERDLERRKFRRFRADEVAGLF
ncbi:MAG: proteasome subunit alpha [Acidobacteria bacterium]|nr:MAG: proteasome subunit alpha [Acidobacteriota bacterium]